MVSPPTFMPNKSVTEKAFRHGTHRLVPPAETLSRLRPLLSKMGITRVANVTGLDAIGIPVVMACRPNARSLSVSQGKGLDLDAAKASAVMESIEFYHAERILLSLKLATWNEMRESHHVVDGDCLPTSPGSTYHPDLSLLWVEGHDVLNDELVWVPYEAVHANFGLNVRVGGSCFPVNSNGLASGNHFLEAISHALCEVIERDAEAAARACRPTPLRLDTVDDAACLDVLEKYERAGVEVVVWDQTSDVGIACFACAIWDRDPSPFRPLYTTLGSGCHPDRSIALLRALTEAAQSRLTFIAGARDDLSRNLYERFLAAGRPQHELDGNPPRHYHDVPNFDSVSFDDDVAWELERLASVGVKQIVVVDLTKSEIGIPVVRVIVPRLEGPSASLRPRLSIR